MYPPTYPQVLWIIAETRSREKTCPRFWHLRRGLRAKSGLRLGAINASVAAPRPLAGDSHVHRYH